jgi:hypothetical protein
MILGRDVHLHAACFDDISASVDRLLIAANDPRIVVFNAHAFSDRVPPGAIIYNLENVDVQISGDAFPGHEVWDFSERNTTRWRGLRRAVHHVPTGYHSSMERFQPLPWNDRDVDIVFAGWMNARRQHVLDALARHGLKIVVLSTVYGPNRDKILARAKIAINMLYYEDGTFPVLRTAHCAANSIAAVSEIANEAPAWTYPAPVPYAHLVESCCDLLDGGEEKLISAAAEALRRFREHPLRLPAQPGR